MSLPKFLGDGACAVVKLSKESVFSMVFLLEERNKVVNLQRENEISSMNVQFDKVKTLNALLYVANRVQRKDFHKIFKVIYFADRQHLADWGRPITGDTYIAMDAGPVPSRLYDILKIVRGDSYLPDNEGLGQYFQVENWMYVRPLVDADLNKLSANEQEALSAAIAKYASLSYDEIKEKSHDVAWRSTARDFAINWDNIAREAGLDGEELECVNEFTRLEAALN